MTCEIIRDLIPLYIDDCCSEESAKAVREHIDGCEDCEELLNTMAAPTSVGEIPKAPVVIDRLNEFKASVLQTVLLFVSFIIITIGVGLEAATPMGTSNGCWALALIAPTTGFMLSLANWYFIRLYKSRKSFSCTSLIATCLFVLSGYLWAYIHYGLLFSKDNIVFYGIGVLLSLLYIISSRFLSSKYALMVGKL